MKVPKVLKSVRYTLAGVNTIYWVRKFAGIDILLFFFFVKKADKYVVGNLI